MYEIIKYRKKPVEGIAMQYKGGNLPPYLEFCEGNAYVGDNRPHDSPNIYIKTLEGDMKISFGDYIVKGTQGEFYPCKPEIFESINEIFR